MKIFEVEFVYDNYDKREANGVGSRKNPFRVRIPFPIKESYNPTYWSVNHRKIEREFENKYNPTIDGSTWARRYWVQAIRRVK